MLIYVALSDDPLSDFFMGEEAMNFVTEQGHVAFCPLMKILEDGANYADSKNKDRMLELANNQMTECDEVWIFGERLGGISFEEKKIAKKFNIKIKRINTIHIMYKIVPEEYI